MKWMAVMFLLTGCAGDPLRRGKDEFPPPVPKGAVDGAYPTRSGFVVMRGGIAWVFEF
jgi:hypothetical protein